MANRIYFYPAWLRIWHLLNAILFLLLIITGLNMQYTNPGSALIRFDIAVNIHNFSGIVLTINYLIFLVVNYTSGNFRFYKIEFKGFFDRLLKQVRYYSFGIFKGEHAPFPSDENRKFNPLQQFTYVAIMYLAVPFIFITGWAMLFPQIIINQLFNLSGYLLTDIIHVIMGFFGSIFLLIHVYFCTIGATPVSNFKSMATGWHEVHD
jgi:thiosulfate reductase cytochrome b subunit